MIDYGANWRSITVRICSCVRDALEEYLEQQRYPLADIEIVVHADADVEIEATLISIEVNEAELDALVLNIKNIENQGGLIHSNKGN